MPADRPVGQFEVVRLDLTARSRAGTLGCVITTSAPTGFGFNPVSAITKGVTVLAKTGVRVASDPGVQRAANAAAAAYNPAATAQA